MTVNSHPTTKSCAKRRALLLRKEEKQSREVINPGLGRYSPNGAV